MRLIEFNNITVRRDGKNVLEDFSLTISAGEHVAIIGPNGAGKSTLLKTITRELYPIAQPNSSARVLEKDRWDVGQLRTKLGIVANDLLATSSIPLTGREVVLSGFFSSVGLWPHHLVTPAMEEKAASLLEQLGVSHLRDRSFSEVSSGEAKRLMIGRALVHDPIALILDEPSTSLDIVALHELRAAMRSLAQSGTGVILVTHHLSEIIPEITRIVLIKQGRIFRDGPKREVLRPEILSELYDIPLEISERDGYYVLV